MPPAVVRLVLLVPCWLAAVYGSLQIHQLDLNLGHSICGPWGCGPPMEALIGYHSFWLALIVPGACLAGWAMPPKIGRRFGWTLAAVGLIGAVGFVGWDVVNYCVNARSTAYLVQRGFFYLVTAVDLPLVQTVIAGCLVAGLGRAKARPDSALEAESAVLSTLRDESNPFQSSSA